MKRIIFLILALSLTACSTLAVVPTPVNAAILAFDGSGSSVPYQTVATLEIARTRADLANKRIVVTSALTAAQSDITGPWPANRALTIEIGGSLANTAPMTINGPFTSGRYEVFQGELITFGPGSVDAVFPEWFGGMTGTTDISAAAQRAFTVSTVSGVPLGFGTGTYTINTQITVGAAPATQRKKVEIQGNGFNDTVISTTSTTGAFKISAANPEVDGSRNDGRVVIRDLTITGLDTVTKVGVGLYLDGLQGITLLRVHLQYLAVAAKFHNCDLVTIDDSWIRLNYTGIYTFATGYASDSYAGGQFNSFVVKNSRITNNTAAGIQYAGGVKPSFVNNNFVLNQTSLRLGDTDMVGSVVTNPDITGNYFEYDSYASIVLGGGSSIVRGGLISANTFQEASGAMGIFSLNVARGQLPRLEHNAFNGPSDPVTHLPLYTTIVDYDPTNPSDNVPDSEVGYTQPTSNTRHGTKKSVGLIINHGASADFMTVIGPSVTSAGILVVDSIQLAGSPPVPSGTRTLRTYDIVLMGGGTVISPRTAAADQYYPAGMIDFTVTETSILVPPLTGVPRNVLTLNNTSSTDDALFIFTYQEIAGVAKMSCSEYTSGTCTGDWH